jgi:two-component system, NtrC family, response regulator AtoC
MTRHPPDKPNDPQHAARAWGPDGETENAAPGVEPSAPAPQQTFLVVRSKTGVALIDAPTEGEWLIGREPDAPIFVDDKRVSRRHGKLHFSAGALALEDLGSRNGTSVNGQRMAPGSSVKLGIGDVVQVGDGEIVVAARASRHPTPAVDGAEDLGDVVVADPEMARLYADVRKVARMPTTTVLIVGETGTGKDVLARRLHAWSPRADKPFARLNCAGIPETLLESELFGYERGAFTGADRRKLGYFEATAGGTLFLDEIGELSAGAQVKLLNVLENRSVVRLGGTAEVPVDVRVVCATHRDLPTLVAEERFRADLYFRISPFVVHIPPLRQRRTEIPLLANVFAQQITAQLGYPPPLLSPAVMAMLTAHAWPGNARQLRNALEHAFAVSEGSVLEVEHFAPEIRGEAALSAIMAPRAHLNRDAERALIEQALVAEGGNQTRAAARLGMPRRTLVYKLAQYRRGG